MIPIRRLPKFIRKGARCAVMLAHHKHRATHPVGLGCRPWGPISRLLGASSPLDDAPASPAGALLPRNRDMGSYGYHKLDSIHSARRQAAMRGIGQAAQRSRTAATGHPLRGRGIWAWRASRFLCVAPLRSAQRSYSKPKCPRTKGIIQIDSRLERLPRAELKSASPLRVPMLRQAQHEDLTLSLSKGRSAGDRPPAHLSIIGWPRRAVHADHQGDGPV